MDLADPQLQQELLSAQLAVKRRGRLQEPAATLKSTIMDKKSAAAGVNAQYSQAELQARSTKSVWSR